AGRQLVADRGDRGDAGRELRARRLAPDARPVEHGPAGGQAGRGHRALVEVEPEAGLDVERAAPPLGRGLGAVRARVVAADPRAIAAVDPPGRTAAPGRAQRGL